MKQQLLAVIDALEDLQATGRYTVMYSVAGHVHDFDVAIYCGKWYKGASPMFRQSIYTDRPLCRRHRQTRPVRTGSIRPATVAGRNLEQRLNDTQYD